MKAVGYIGTTLGLLIGIIVPVATGGVHSLIVGLPILLVMGLVWLWVAKLMRSMPKPADIRDGIDGTATIVSFRPGGMRVTMGAAVSLTVIFTLDVDLPGQAPYRVTGFRTLFPEIRLGMLNRGARVAVRVDRTNPRRMALDLDAAMSAPNPYAMSPANPYARENALEPLASAAQIGALFQELANRGQLATEAAQVHTTSAAELLARGTPGRARVLTATPTGQALADGRFVYAFTMQVWLRGVPQPIDAAILHAVPPQAMARAVPGSSLAVAVDASNPTRAVAIDWNQA